MLIRAYSRGDAAAITRLFYETVRSVNSKDYSEHQVRAWAPAAADPEIWHSRMIQRCTLVAEENGEVLAFAELERNGHLDMLYCRKDVIGQGIGRLLYEEVEAEAIRLGLDRIFGEASITARAFFKRRGFSVVGEQTVSRGGIELSNFRMEKRLRTKV